MNRILVDYRWAESHPEQMAWLIEQFATAETPVVPSDTVQESHAAIETDGRRTQKACPLTDAGMSTERLKDWLGFIWSELGYFVMPGQHIEGE